MPASVMMQFCLITSLSLSLTTVISWSLLLIAMAVPYIFAGVVVSMALTRSPFPTGRVYGVDLLGRGAGMRGGGRVTEHSGRSNDDCFNWCHLWGFPR